MTTQPAPRDPASPFVTYYDGTTGERTELSTTSLLNWQAKTANLLADAYDLAPDSVIGLQLPVHWLTPVFAGAAAALPARLAIAGSSSQALAEPSVAVIGPTALTAIPPADEVLACSLLPMAMGFREELPIGIDDFFTEVRSHGDYFPGLADSPGYPALDTVDGHLRADEVRQAAADYAQSWQVPPAGRLLIVLPGGAQQSDPAEELTLGRLLAVSAVPWLMGGSVVIVRNTEPVQLATIAEQERIDITVPE